MSDKLSTNKQKKAEQVKALSEKVAKAKAIVFTNYQGMTHKQLEELKKGLKKTNAELTVTKNTLMKRALEESSTPSTSSTFEWPTATLFAYDDIVTPLKELAKSIKATTLPKIKFGLAKRDLASPDSAWDMLKEAEVIRLSTLPSREQLLAQVVSGMKSPIYGLHRALNWNLQKFVMTLSAIESKKAISN